MKRIGYDDVLYRREDFAWVSSSFSQCFLNIWDETFYDRAEGKFKVDSFLQRGATQFGGYDSVILWHAYPRIGYDDRNQFDFYRDMPGGLRGLRELVRAFHSRGVKVLIPYNPWDTGTRREGKPDLEILADIIKTIHADGIFLDTWASGPAAFRGALDSARPGVVLESEGDLPIEEIPRHHMSWAQYFAYPSVPGVLRNKWLERRHMQHQTKRWSLDHSDELHTAWMNGSGILVWEDVFGSWVGTTPRDRSILRAMLPIQRRYAELFSGERWTPLVPSLVPAVYANLWEGKGLRLWTIVNCSDREVHGPILKVPHIPGARYFDVVAGKEIVATISNGMASLAGRIRPRGIAAIVSGKRENLGKDFPAFLAHQAATDSRTDFSTETEEPKLVLRPVKSVVRRKLPPGMAEIPPTVFEMKVEFRYSGREQGTYEPYHKIDRSGPWGKHGPIYSRAVTLGHYAIDLTPVTNAQYKEFLDDARYEPKRPENFLKHWVDGSPPPGKEDHPVVYVDLDDARAYAAWAGKRLPTEAEWQYAAQGPERLLYPWGNAWTDGVCNSRSGETSSVTAFPGGRSPFGCYDMCGNVWEWTESEHTNGRTRFCIIRGGSSYEPEGSQWYADGGPVPANFAAKFLLVWPGLDRCSTIGFRCVVDLASD